VFLGICCWGLVVVVVVVIVEKWRLKINRDKSKVVVFDGRTNSDVSSLNFVLDGQNVEVKNSYKYLGIIFNQDLKWSSNIEYLGDKS